MNSLTHEQTAAILKRPVDFDCSIADRPFPFWIHQNESRGCNAYGHYHFTTEAEARDYADSLNLSNPRWGYVVFTWNPAHLADKQVLPKGMLV
jgi:hypothetical protein